MMRMIQGFVTRMVLLIGLQMPRRGVSRVILGFTL